MSDEQRQPSFEEVLVNRMAQRLGVAHTQIEVLQLQLEQAQAEIERLQALVPTDVEPPMNGERTEEWQQSAPI
jgi:hypothetical protein